MTCAACKEHLEYIGNLERELSSYDAAIGRMAAALDDGREHETGDMLSMRRVTEDVSRLTLWAVRMQRAFGGGDRLAGELMLNDVAERLHMARDKHSWSDLDSEAACEVIGEEWAELCAAVEHESRARQRDEALDVAVTALRFAAGEHVKA